VKPILRALASRGAAKGAEELRRYGDMKDPVFAKLKDDAGSLLNELVKAITHQRVAGEREHCREISPSPDRSELKPAAPAQDGLCYFHLN